MAKTYFPHDSNARNSKKLLRLRKKHGAAGYGVYFMLIERLTEEEDFCSDLDYDMLAYELHVKPETVKAVVENFELFEIKTDEVRGKTFQSAGLLERMELRGIRSAAGKKGAAARWKTNTEGTDDAISEDENAIAKDSKTMTKVLFANGKEMAKEQFANSIKEDNNKEKINNNPFFYVFPFFFTANGKYIDIPTLTYLVLERNMPNAEKELEKLIAYNNVQGRKWEDMTTEQRIAAAQLWSPRTQAAKNPRFSREFIDFWKQIITYSVDLKAHTSIIQHMLSDKVREGVRRGDTYILVTTGDVADWIESNSMTLRHTVKALLNKMGCKTFEYEIIDKPQAKEA